jgi:hypothetical protein
MTFNTFTANLILLILCFCAHVNAHYKDSSIPLVLDFGKFFKIPDGTLVAPFLNSKSVTNKLPFNVLNGFSAAAGIIESKTNSKIHVLPHVTMATLVLEGEVLVTVHRKGKDQTEDLSLVKDQTLLTEPNTIIQWRNQSDRLAKVIYIVSPPYLFEKVGSEVIYDDSIMIEASWSKLEYVNWDLKKLGYKLPTFKQRSASYGRLRQRKSMK